MVGFDHSRKVSLKLHYLRAETLILATDKFLSKMKAD